MSFRRLSLCFALFIFSTLQAVTWLPPVSLDPKGACTPQIVGDAEGTVLAVWTHLENGGVSVQAAELDKGVWSPAISLSTAKKDGIVSGTVMDTKGNAVAVWRAEGTAYAATYSNQWSTPVQLSPASDMIVPPQVVTDNQGNFLAVWAANTASGVLVQSARFTVGNNVWVPLSDFLAYSVNYLRVGMDASGNAILAWNDYANWTNIVNVSFLPAGTNQWTASQTLASDQSFSPVLSVNPAGNAIVAWYSFADSSIQASTYERSTGKWTPTQSPGQARIWQDVLQVFYSPEDSATAIWTSLDGAVQTANLAKSSTTWSQPQSLTDQGQSPSNLQLSASQEGKLLAAWYNATPGSIQAALGTDTGWSAPLTVVSDYWPEFSNPLIGPDNRAFFLFSDAKGVQSITGKDLLSLPKKNTKKRPKARK